MATYYCDTAADTGGDGTTTELTGSHCAFKTLAQAEALSSLNPGDAVYLKRGCLWREDFVIPMRSGTAALPITYGAYGSGALPIICGANLVGTWTVYSGSVWQAALTKEPRFVLFNGTVGSKKASIGACTAQYDWYWASNVLYTYAASDPDTLYTSPGVEASDKGWGFTTEWNSNVNHITVENLHIYGQHNGPGIFSTRSTGWTVHDCTIEKLGAAGMQMRAPTDLTIYNCTLTGIRNLDVPGAALHGIHCYYEDATYVGANLHVYDCDITYWPTYAVAIAGYSFDHRFVGVYVHDCDLSHNATGCYPGECDTGELYNLTCDDNLNPYRYEEEYGVALETVSNFSVHHCTCTNGRVGMEIWAFDGDKEAHPEWWYTGQSNNNKVHHNEFSGNTENGFLVYMGYVNNLELYTNVIFDNHDGGMTISEVYGTGTGNVVYNNTVCRNNIDDGGYADIYLGTADAGWTFKNNIMYNTNRLCFRAGNAYFAGVHSHNCYYRTDSGNVVDNYGTTYTAATVTTFEPTAIGQDPVFVSTATPDWHLQATSPCIDAAEDVGLTTDYDGNPIV